MEQSFKLIKNVDPRFAKLTLSKKKVITEQIEIPTVSTIPSKKLFDDNLTDDDSESERQELNRIFRSRTTPITELEPLPQDDIQLVEGNSKRMSHSFSQRLQVSDSDVTSISVDDEGNLEQLESHMDQLGISIVDSATKQSSPKLFTDTDEPEDVLQLVSNEDITSLSTRISSLGIKCEAGKNAPVDRELENIFRGQKQEPIESAGDNTIMTISSTRSTPLTTSSSDVIVISESDSEPDYSNHVSNIHPSGETQHSDNLTGTIAERLNAFFNNIPSLDSPQQRFKSNGLGMSESINENLLIKSSNKENSVVIDDSEGQESIEICETSCEEEDVSKTPSPKKYLKRVVQTESSSKEKSDSVKKLPKKQTPAKNVQISPPKKHSLKKTAQSESSPKQKSDSVKKPPKNQTPAKTIQISPPVAKTPRKQKSDSSKKLPSKKSSTPSNQQPTPSGSSYDEPEYRIEKINISAKIKINVKLIEPIITTIECTPPSNTSNSITDDNKELSQSEPNQVTSEAQEIFQNNETYKTPENKSKLIVETVNNKNDHNEPEIELDDAAKSMLDKIYGNEWRTPAIVKMVKKSPNQQKRADDTLLQEFSIFHKDNRDDLESTRLPVATSITAKCSPKKTDSIFKVPVSDRKALRCKKDDEVMRGSNQKKSQRKARKNPIHVSDSDGSDKDFDASSEESWNDAFSFGSDNSSDEIETPLRKVKPRKKKNASKDDLIYLDLSSNEVKVQKENGSPVANHDEQFQEHLKNILATCKHVDKPKLEVTPKQGPKSKRKLFTPRFGEDDEALPMPAAETSFKSPPNNEKDSSVTLKTPLPAMFEAINKQLESVKTGKPIFSIKKSKPKTEKNKENQTPSPSPKHTSIANKTSNRSNVQLLDTPCDKYGFLKSLDVIVSKNFCHPDALMYRENYKSKKNELAEKLYDIYNAKIFKSELNVPLSWNNKLLNTAGRCSNSSKSRKRSSRIELSEKVLTSADRLRCTLIHEMCHAATWIYNAENGHGATWKRWARKANAIFPELPKIGICHQYDIDYKYTYKCTLCSAKSHAHSKSKKVENIRCSYCHGAIEIFLNKKDKEGNVVPTPVREATGFAKFVKEKYKLYRKPDLKHADVMKILSNEFAQLNVKK